MPIQIKPLGQTHASLNYDALRHSVYHKDHTGYNELDMVDDNGDAEFIVPDIFNESEDEEHDERHEELEHLKNEISHLIDVFEKKIGGNSKPRLQHFDHLQQDTDRELEQYRETLNAKRHTIQHDDQALASFQSMFEGEEQNKIDNAKWHKIKAVSMHQGDANRFVRVVSKAHSDDGHDLSRIVDTNHFFDYLSFTEPPEWYIWLPCSDSRIYWDVMVLSLVAYYGFAVPVMIAFPESHIPLGLEVIFVMVFMCDIFMNFITAFEITTGKNQGWLETRLDLIAARYFKFWFWIDIISTIPFDMFLGSGGTWMRLTKIVRLLRICRAGRIFDRIFCYLRTHPSIVRLVRYLVYLAFVLHWIACGFWYIGGMYEFDNEWNFGIIEGEESDIADQSMCFKYLNALLWSIWISTGTGNTQHPRRPSEAVFTAIGTLVGVLMYAFIVGSASSALGDMDTSSSTKSRRIQQIQQFLANRGVDKHLSQEIVAYYEYRWAQKMTTGDEDIFQCLHGTLKRTLRFALHKDIIRNVPLFKDVTEPIVEGLISSCISRIYLPNEWVILRGERGKGMYFIYRGLFEVIPDIHQPPVAVLCDGQSFGEMAVLTAKRRNSSVRSVCHGELLFLSKKSFKEIIHRYPVFAITVEKWSPHCRHAKGWAKVRQAVRLMKKLSKIGLYQNFRSMMNDLCGVDTKCNTENVDRFIDGLGKGHLLRAAEQGLFANKHIQIANREKFFQFVVNKAQASTASFHGNFKFQG